jgi:hypothetical protein
MSEGPQKRTWVDEIEVAGSQLVERIRELIGEGNARRVIIRSKDGHELLAMPLTVGVVGGGILTLAAPIWAAVGALAALVTQVKLEVIREEDEPPSTPDQTPPPPPPENPA